ncbi:MAG: o-succinylbenzoate synthase [Flavobacteriales bacterium]|nr:o-succinylbenzoate synthase [Flavobacteriales bacterium]
MIRGFFFPYVLKFRKPSGTSRGILTEKKSWFLVLEDTQMNHARGIGEVGWLRGLSPEKESDIEDILADVCNSPDNPQWLQHDLLEFPSVRFALEQALLDLDKNQKGILFPSAFTRGEKAIDINGLVWMAPIEQMRAQVKEKIEQGFRCIKLKIGALDFEDEYHLLSEIRSEFTSEQIEIRVDANGAFHPDEAAGILEKLARLELHSIEQPIKQGQLKSMAELCKNTPLPIALDEELIGIAQLPQKIELLNEIQPQYIILKPSLTGGFISSEEWIALAEQKNIGWWITSALESNIGLNAIAQWTATLQNNLPQGLGTGALYTNNFESSLEVKNGQLHFHPDRKREYPFE